VIERSDEIAVEAVRLAPYTRAQRKFLADATPERVMLGAYRCGKTEAMRAYAAYARQVIRIEGEVRR